MTIIQFHRRAVDIGPDLLHFHRRNMDKFGALKAIGAKSRHLTSVNPVRATFTALTGYGLGIRALRAGYRHRQDKAARLRRDLDLWEMWRWRSSGFVLMPRSQTIGVHARFLRSNRSTFFGADRWRKLPSGPGFDRSGSARGRRTVASRDVSFDALFGEVLLSSALREAGRRRCSA